MDQESRLRLRSLWLSRMTLLLLVATALVIVQPVLLGIGAVLGDSALRGGTLRSFLAFSAVMWLPSLFYLYALWAISGAFSYFARGGTIGTAMAQGCRRAGIALAIGATASAIGVPNLLRLLIGQGLIANRAYGNRTVLVFDTAYLAVGVVGLALFLLGGLLERAADVQREAQKLQAELREFF
jgi:hypothetical protein